MKKSIFVFLVFLCLSFNILIVPSVAQSNQPIKHGIYTIENLNLSPNTLYNIENTSFSDRIYVLIFDPTLNVLQATRLWPQSQKYNLVPIQAGYKILVIGDGELVIS